MDVVACKTKALRGQAWVVFADVSSAADAMRQMQGFPFFDKPMRLAYAKTKSDAVAKAEGVPVGKRKRNDDMVGMGDDGDEEAAPPAAKRVNLAEAVSSAAAGAPLAAAAALVMPLPPAPTPVIAPSNVLLATGLPMDGSISSDQLRTLFSTYPGFKDVRHIVERGIAFVEYGNEAQSTPALQVGAQDCSSSWYRACNCIAWLPGRWWR